MTLPLTQFKGHNSKSINTRVMVLAFCMSSNVGENLYEVSWRYLERFMSYRADTTISQSLLFSISKGHNSKNAQSRVMVLTLCISSHNALYLCKVSWKYLKRSLIYRAGQKQYVSQYYGKGGGGGRHNHLRSLWAVVMRIQISRWQVIINR